MNIKLIASQAFSLGIPMRDAPVLILQATPTISSLPKKTQASHTKPQE